MGLVTGSLMDTHFLIMCFVILPQTRGQCNTWHMFELQVFAIPNYLYCQHIFHVPGVGGVWPASKMTEARVTSLTQHQRNCENQERGGLLPGFPFTSSLILSDDELELSQRIASGYLTNSWPLPRTQSPAQSGQPALAGNSQTSNFLAKGTSRYFWS